MADAQVVDNAEQHRFELEVEGHLAELVYRLDGDRMVLTHTRVPEELGGRGLGGVLVQAAADRAKADGRTLVPQCPFARAWLEKHPDVASTLSIDWPPASDG